MGEIEKRFLSRIGKTLISSSNENADLVCRVLKKALGKSDWVARGGMSSNYYFNFDKIYNKRKQKQP